MKTIVNKAGIYMIRNALTGSSYIGSAVNIAKRWSVHLCQLRKGKHHSKKLQRAWNKYGESAFALSVIEEVTDKSRLLLVEQMHLDRIKNWRASYNSNPVAGSSLWRALSKETRKKIAAKAIGRRASEATRKKMSDAKLGRKHSPDHASKLAEQNRLRAAQPISEGTRRRMSESAKRRVSHSNNRGPDGRFFGAQQGVRWSDEMQVAA